MASRTLIVPVNFFMVPPLLPREGGGLTKKAHLPLLQRPHLQNRVSPSWGNVKIHLAAEGRSDEESSRRPVEPANLGQLRAGL